MVVPGAERPMGTKNGMSLAARRGGAQSEEEAYERTTRLAGSRTSCVVSNRPSGALQVDTTRTACQLGPCAGIRTYIPLEQ